MTALSRNRTREGLFLFAEDGRMCAALTDAMPSIISVRGITYWQGSQSLGDYDYVRDSHGHLVGFAFNLSGREYNIVSPLRGTEGLHLEQHEVTIVLDTGVDKWTRECVQASSVLYRSSSGAILIGLDKWREFDRLQVQLMPLQ